MKAVLCSIAVMVLAGCSSVVMQEPFPDSTLTREEMEALRGTWHSENDVFYVDFTTNGMPAMASVEWKNNQHTLIRHDLHIAKRGDSFYLSVNADTGDEPEEHVFAAFKPRDGEIIVWGPDLEFFKNQIAEEKLKGTVKEDGNATEIHLTSPSTVILERVATDRDAFDYDEPLIFKRLD